MKQLKRALDSEQKSERRQVILDSAVQLYLKSDKVMPSVSQIAKRAGLAKGTVYLYFKTKEEIFLNILEQEIDLLFREIFERISKEPSITPSKIINTIVKSVGKTSAFLSLGSLANYALETNIESEILYQFKLRIANWVTDYGMVIEELLPQLQEGSGGRLIIRTYVGIIGVSQIMPASKKIEELVSKPGLEIFNINFVDELQEVLETLWRGTLQR